MLSIGGIDYEVGFGDPRFTGVNEAGEEVEHHAVAHVNFMDAKIMITPEMGDQFIDLSFLHEVVHAITFSMGYQPGSIIPNDEVFTEGFANILLQVMNQILEFNMEHPHYEESYEEDEEVIDLLEDVEELDYSEFYVGNVENDDEEEYNMLNIGVIG